MSLLLLSPVRSRRGAGRGTGLDGWVGGFAGAWGMRNLLFPSSSCVCVCCSLSSFLNASTGVTCPAGEEATTTRRCVGGWEGGWVGGWVAWRGGGWVGVGGWVMRTKNQRDGFLPFHDRSHMHGRPSEPRPGAPMGKSRSSGRDVPWWGCRVVVVVDRGVGCVEEERRKGPVSARRGASDR